MTATEAAPLAGAHDPNLLLQVEGVDKSFPGVKALEGMRFDLRKGEVLGLVGENGAGKSTMMKLLTGIYTREAGDFWLNGKPLEVRTPKEAQEAGLSIIHQELNLVPHLNVAENIWLGREPVSGGFFTRPGAQVQATRDLLARLRQRRGCPWRPWSTGCRNRHRSRTRSPGCSLPCTEPVSASRRTM